MNNNLKGIIIDPGHGGIDSGARGNNSLEKDFSLKISKYLYDRFKELGIPVVLTREGDTTLSPTERVDKILSSFGNNKDVILISNHLNAGGGTGAEVIYALRNNSALADSILNNIGLTGQKKRKTYQRTLPTNPTKDYYFIHRNTGNIEPLIIEYGFIDGDKKELDFLKNNYKELAEAVIKSILDYKNIPYTKPSMNTNNNYIVQKGDTIYKIANKYNTTINEIKKLNNLKTDTLNIGEILLIPNNNNNTYTVKEGDTLYRIANLNNTTVDILKDINNLNSDTLSIGQILLLPNKELINISTDYINYSIKENDTLYSIAKQYNTTVDILKDINNLKSDILSIGQNLKIPIKNAIEIPSSTITYTIKPGDTLYSIAKQYNTTINNLKELNNLKTNLISIGDTILIK